MPKLIALADAPEGTGVKAVLETPSTAYLIAVIVFLLSCQEKITASRQEDATIDKISLIGDDENLDGFLSFLARLAVNHYLPSRAE
jgi:hypothetical protein